MSVVKVQIRKIYITQNPVIKPIVSVIVDIAIGWFRQNWTWGWKQIYISFAGDLFQVQHIVSYTVESLNTEISDKNGFSNLFLTRINTETEI